MSLLLETERLLLRPLEAFDVDIETEMGTDPDVMKFIDAVQTEEEVAAEMPLYVRRCAMGCIGVWCVTDRATQEKYGSAILLPLPIDADDTEWDLVVGDEIPDREIEVGYMFKKSAWGRGYATETSSRLLQFAFEVTPLDEVVAVTDPEHVASQNVLKKCGLIEEGTRRAYAEPCSGFRISRQQWLERS